MATLVLTAVGSVFGGKFGGALGSLAGRMIDGAIFGGPKREGPRLKELAVTTSSYGSAIARHFGTVRAPGSVIWATDLVEHKNKSGGGKGKPKVTTYSYSMSFAVAVASRPISGIGRIWADGNLLRGTDDDLKVGGTLRIYPGTEDQPLDPLIEADIGTACPGFRGLAYVVFEDLQLADFGNRMPSLTFEIIADETAPELADLLDCEPDIFTDAALPGLAGLSYDGGTEVDFLAALDDLYPLSCDGSGGELSIRTATPSRDDEVIALPSPVKATGGEFGSRTGTLSRRDGADGETGIALRYYDIGRDYQPGLQRSRGRPGNGLVTTLEFPASLRADDARKLADGVATRRQGARKRMSYRIARLDDRIVPGALVRPAGERGVWRVRAWEWLSQGIELELDSVSPESTLGLVAPGDAGRAAAAVDRIDGPTVLAAFELPWDGSGTGGERQIYAAASSSEPGWSGAELYVDGGDGALIPAGTANRIRAILGTTLGKLPAATPHLIDRSSSIVVQLVGNDLVLDNTDMAGLMQGSNRARIGNEIVQFANATPLSEGQWRLSQFLRGRGGTEWAIEGHAAGEYFVLLDDSPTAIDPALVGVAPSPTVAALGNADFEPVIAPIIDAGASLRPLTPVKGRIETHVDGGVTLHWVRRARGGWAWLDEVDVPLVEPSEIYDVRFIDGNGDQVLWQVAAPQLHLGPADWTPLSTSPGPAFFEVRQVGAVSRSRPLKITS